MVHSSSSELLRDASLYQLGVGCNKINYIWSRLIQSHTTLWENQKLNLTCI